jgi:hypothetical protein
MSFVFTAQTIWGKKINVEVMSSYTIGEVKTLICERFALLGGDVHTPESVRLFRLFGVGVLKDEHTLAHYQIEDALTVGVMFKES